MRLVHGDTLAFDFRMVLINIPAAASVAKTVIDLVRNGTSNGLPLGNELPDWWDRVSTWEIVENDAAFNVGQDEAMSVPVLPRAAGIGLNPPVSADATKTKFLKADAGGRVLATFIGYIIDEDVMWSKDK